MRQRLIAWCLGACWAVPAASAEVVTEIDLLAEIPQVNAGTRLQQRLTEVPASVTVIDRDMIAASGATEIVQLFRLVPGFLSYSVFGNQLGVSTRALSTDFPGHLEVIVDGRSVYQPALSTVIWTALGIDIQDIDYIEVVRGSNTPAYGSNAFQGAINIVTRAPLSGARVSLRAVGGSLDTRDLSARYTGHAGDVSYAVSMLSRHNTGFPPLDEPDEPWPLHTTKDDADLAHLRLQALYTPTLRDELSIQLGIGEDRLQLPENDVRGYHNRDMDSHYQSLRWTRWLDHGDVTLNFYHNYLHIADDTVLGRLSELTGLTAAQVPLLFPGQSDEVLRGDIRDGLSERYHLELQHTLEASENLRLVWGGALRLDRLGSRFLLGDDDIVDEEQYHLFANADWRFQPRWHANLGVMLEHNNLVGSFASPRLGLNYQWRPTQMLRASYTAGKRTPSLLSFHQETAVTFADGTLIDRIVTQGRQAEEERINVLELGYLGYFLDGDLTLDMKLFKEQARDLRYDIEQPDVDIDGRSLVWRNGLHWDTQGFEAQLQYRLGRRWLLSWQYAYMDIDGLLPDADGPKELGDNLPTHNTSLLVSYHPRPEWAFSSVIYHTSAMDWTAGDDVDEITRVDLRAARRIRLGRWQGTLELLVHNAFDDYLDYDKDNVFERRAFLRASLDFD